MSINNLYSELEYITSVSLLTVEYIFQQKGIQTIDLAQLPLQKGQKYMFSILIRVEDGYFNDIRNRKKQQWFSFTSIYQNCGNHNTLPKL